MQQKLKGCKVGSKGQIISKGLFKDFVWAKKLTIIFLYFCPIKSGQIKSGKL